MKSEERQDDLRLLSLGGPSAVNNRREQKVKVKAVANKNQKGQVLQKSKHEKPIKHIKSKPSTKGKKTVVAIKAQKNSKKPIPQPAKEITVPISEKLMITLAKTKSNIVQSALTVRKKMPGYVYPSRQDMLLDQKHKEDILHRKEVEVQQQQSN